MNDAFKDGDREIMQVTDWQMGESMSGTPYVAVKLLNKKGEATFYQYLTTGCAGRIRGFLKAFGYSADDVDIEQLDKMHPKAINLLNKDIQVFFKEDEYAGITSIKADRIQAPSALTDPKAQKVYFDALNAAVKAAKKRPKDGAEEEEENPRF